MLAYPIEPKNPTQLICEALQERFDVEYERKALSGLTPHDWHAQAVFTVKVMERTLGKGVGFHILHAQYGTGEEGAASARHVSEWLNPEAPADSREREVTDMLTAHILRGRPRLRDLCDSSICRTRPYNGRQVHTACWWKVRDARLCSAWISICERRASSAQSGRPCLAKGLD
ncbi:hypothetical protein G6F66_014523 [Rhizopus arrhizus]|nr:hypothetical protein G6F66_014523 [Rhizopus arrhizus]